MTNIYIIGYIKWFDSGFITDDKQSQQHLFGHAFNIFLEGKVNYSSRVSKIRASSNSTSL